MVSSETTTSTETMSKEPPPSYYESYPPLFRPKSSCSIHLSGQDDEPPGKEQPDSDPLPVIDLQGLTTHDELHKERLAEACEEWGMFRLVNHGVPRILVDQLHRHARELFSASFESKQGGLWNSGAGPITYFWGSPALNPDGLAVQRLGPNNTNWVEGLNVPLGQLPQLQAQDPMLDTFRLLLEEYGRHQSRIASAIFRTVTEKLSPLSQGQWESYLCPATGFLRVYRYPVCFEPNRDWGMDVHTDSSVLSILDQDEVGGLQVYKDHQWLQVQPIPDTLVVNLGDMMQAMSDDKYKSVKHGVKASKERERISIGYFVFPAEDAVIKSSKYKPFSYADFRAQVQQDLTTVGRKVGLDRFKISEDEDDDHGSSS